MRSGTDASTSPPTTGATEGFSVSSVTFGTQELSAHTTLDVKVLAIDPAAPLLRANLEPIASTTADVTTADAHTLTTVPLVADVPAGKDMVVEIDAPAGSGYFIGGNAEPELAEAYVSSTACGIPEPTPPSAYGLNESHLVFHANGKAGECVTAEEVEAAAAAAVRLARQQHRAANADRMQARTRTVEARAAFREAREKHGKSSRQAERARKTKLEAIDTLAEARQGRRDLRAVVVAAVGPRRQAAATQAAECAQPALPQPPARSKAPSSTRLSGGLSTSGR